MATIGSNLVPAGKLPPTPGTPSRKVLQNGKITPAPLQHSRCGAMAGDDGSDGDEVSGDSAGEQHGNAEDADVQALSGVAALTMEPSTRLAGNKEDAETLSDVDESMSDDMTASAGAQGSQGGGDEDYSGLASISDDGHSLQDGGEDELLKAAEVDLIREFEKKEERTQKALDDTFWLSNGFLDDDDNDESLVTGNDDDLFGIENNPNLDDDPFGGAKLFDTNWTGMVEHAEDNFWEGSFLIGPSAARPKRVRFEEGVRRSRSPSESSSDSDDDDEPSSHFPDIFMDQEDPKIQRLLSYDLNDGDLAGPGSDAGSVYDFEDDGDKFIYDVNQDSDSSEDDDESESDGNTDDDIDYETEDESLEEQKAKMLELRKASRSSLGTSAPPTPTKSTSGKRPITPLARPHGASKSSSPKSNRGPRKGTFVCDPTKATVVTDESGKATVLYMPTQPSEKHKAFWDRARSAASSKDSSPRGSMSIVLPSQNTKETPQRPFTAQSTLATMFDGNMDFMRNNDITPQPPILPQATYIPMLSSFNSIATTDEASEIEEDFTMLIDLDPESDTDAPSPGGFVSDVPAIAPTFLSHGTVGSFRLNQDRARQESSLASHPDSRASTSEQNALQSGRRGAGNAPITPARKKRVSKDLTRTGSGIRKPTTPAMSSPLASRRRSRGQSISGRLDHTLAPGFSGWK